MVLQKRVINNYFDYFNVFFSASIIYALLSVLLIYNNINGMGKTLFATLTCLYAWYCLLNSGIKIKDGTKILMGFIVLLGLSIFNTSDALVIFINEALMFITLIISFVHSYVDDDEWQLVEYIKTFIKTVFAPMALIGRITPKGEINYMQSVKSKQPNNVNGADDCSFYTSEDVGTIISNSDSKLNIFKIGYIFIGILISLCLLGIILPLLFSADQLFEELFTKILASTNIMVLNWADLFGMILLFTFLLFASFLGIRYLNLGKVNNNVLKERGKVNELIGVTILIVMSIVYVIFSSVQIFGLFLNEMHLPVGETFSSYARNGFFQLLNVAFINLIMIVTTFYLFNKSRIIKILLTIISACTYIILASSIYRLMLYIEEYQLTKLRLYALWGLIVVLFGLTGAVISIYKENFRFVRYGFISLLVLWTVFSFARPEYIIAKYNLSQTLSKTVDVNYIASFSSDASGPIYEYIVKNKINVVKKEDLSEYSSGAWGMHVIEEYFTYEQKGVNNCGLKCNLSKLRFNKYRKMLFK